MARCYCGAVIPGWDCSHCPETKIWTCPGCGHKTLIYNEAKRREDDKSPVIGVQQGPSDYAQPLILEPAELIKKKEEYERFKNTTWYDRKVTIRLDENER